MCTIIRFYAQLAENVKNRSPVLSKSLLSGLFLSRYVSVGFCFVFGRHFAQWEVDEEKVVESWISHMDTDRDVRELGAVKK